MEVSYSEEPRSRYAWRHKHSRIRYRPGTIHRVCRYEFLISVLFFSVDELYAVSVAMDSLMLVVNGFSQLKEESSNDETLRSMVRVSLSPILVSFTTLLEHSYDDEQVSLLSPLCLCPFLTPVCVFFSYQIQFFLIGLQTFCLLCGNLDVEEAFKSILTALCSFAIPPSLHSSDGSYDLDLPRASNAANITLNTLNSQAIKTLFNICHTLPHKLSNAW